MSLEENLSLRPEPRADKIDPTAHRHERPRSWIGQGIGQVAEHHRLTLKTLDDVGARRALDQQASLAWTEKRDPA